MQTPNLYFLILLIFLPIRDPVSNFKHTQLIIPTANVVKAKLYPQIEPCINFFNLAFIGNDMIAGRCYKGQQLIQNKAFVVHSIYLIIPSKFKKQFELTWFYPMQQILNRHQQWIGVEDPRFFYFKEWYLQFTGDASDSHIRTMHIIPINTAIRNALPTNILTDIDNKPTEKNWAFFGETNLHAIYSLTPFTVGLVHGNKLNLLWKSDFDCLSGHITIATNALRVELHNDAYYLIIYHDRETTDYYKHYVLLIQGSYPFKPLRRSSHPLKINAAHKKFIYLSSLNTESGNPVADLDSILILSGGIDDTQGVVMKTTAGQLLSRTTAICQMMK